MFNAIDLELWQKQLRDQMDQYWEKFKPRETKKPEVKLITAEGRVYSPQYSGSIYSYFKNEAIQRLLASSQHTEVILKDCVQSAKQNTTFVEEAFQKFILEALSMNVHENGHEQIGVHSEVVNNCALSNTNGGTDDETTTVGSETSANDNDEMTELDEVISLSLVGQNLSKYISLLPESHRKHAVTSIIKETVNWVSLMFRFPDAAGKFHDESLDGLASICKRLIFQKFPDFESQGFKSFYKSPPVIYMGEGAISSIGHQLCVQLGLPLSSLCTVPCNTKLEGSEAMDSDSLSDLITEDFKSERTPLVVVACAGTPTLGHVDNFLRLQEICSQKKIWLHVTGSHLAHVCLLEPPTNIAATTVCSSMTLNIGAWLSLAGVSYVTLIKTPKEMCSLDMSMDSPTATDLCRCLPLWICLQHLGQDGVAARINHSLKLSLRLRDQLKEISSVELIPSPKRRQTQHTNILNIPGLLSKVVNTFLVSSCPNPTVVFRYKGSNVAECSAQFGNTDFTSSVDAGCSSDCYLNNMNIWLCEMLNSLSTNIIVKPVLMKDGSMWMQFSPLDDNCFVYAVEEGDIDTLIKHISSQQSMLESCTVMNRLLQTAVRSYSNLQVVKSSNKFHWRGIGAVRCMLNDWLSHSTDNDSSTDVSKLNAFNESVVQRINFSHRQLLLDKSSSCQWSIMLGIVTEESALNDLLTHISSTAIELEELEKKRAAECAIADIIITNIQKASAELHRERQTQNQALVRSIPVIGSLVSWMSPSKNTCNGRSFILPSGVLHGEIESTVLLSR